MSEISLIVDGRSVVVPAGATLLDAARAVGAYVPTLCHDPLLRPSGACRLCVVEVDGYQSLLSSCTTPAEDGMVVRTGSRIVADARRIALELIIADHPLDCLTCRRNQRCELQRVAAHLGVSAAPPRPTRRTIPIDTSNPFFDRDMAKCILCGRCVRACDEIRGVKAIQFAGRGYETRIAAAMDRPIITSNCESCGQCVDSCPTGALVDRNYVGLPDREVRTICPYCGCGCGMILQVKGERLIGAIADRDSPAGKGSLCVKGRYGLDFVHHADRLTKPLIRRDGRLVEVTWDEALDLVADRLAEHRGRFAALASAKCTNEENFVLQKLTRAVMRTNNIDHCARV